MTRLLNDDGSASMATALLMSHHAFRRDIARFEVALRGRTELDAAHAAVLTEEWTQYHAALHGHHQIEDTAMFPGMRTQHPDLGPIFDRLSADHRQIDPLLELGDRAFASVGTAPTAAAGVVAELSALLDRHLTLEEAHVVQFLRDAKGFPPPASPAELDLYAGGFAWSSDGIAPEVLAKLDEMLPPGLVERLPTAREAFATRRVRVWGNLPVGAAVTSIPDALAP